MTSPRENCDGRERPDAVGNPLCEASLLILNGGGSWSPWEASLLILGEQV